MRRKPSLDGDPHRLTRRDALRGLAGVVVVLALDACTPGPEPSTQAPSAQPVPVPVPGNEAAPAPTNPGELPFALISGELPGEYSEFVRRHNLQPITLEKKTASEIEAITLQYLENFLQACSEVDPAVLEPDFKELNIISDRNFPIDLDNPTLKEIVSNLVTDWKTGNLTVKFVDGGDFRSRGVLQNTPAGWKLLRWETEMGFNRLVPYFMDDAGETARLGLTSAEMAILMIHEYAHYRSDRKLLDAVNTGEGLSVLTNVNVDTPEKPNQFEQATPKMVDDLITQIKNAHNIRIAKEVGVSGIIEGHEAVANAIHMFATEVLRRMNETEHVQGTERIDPSAFDVKIIKGQGHPEFENLFHIFQARVLGTSRHALDTDWLLTARAH